MKSSPFFIIFPISVLIALVLWCSGTCWALASNNMPLDSPVYSYLEKLAGFGLIHTDIAGLRPYAKAEVARLLLEAKGNLDILSGEEAASARDFIQRINELIPREAALYSEPASAPPVDYTLLSGAQLRYVYLDGVPRSYDRPVFIRGGQNVFGFIGGKLRPDSDAGVLPESGTEGTPLLENNEGIVYRKGSNGELRWSMEGFVKDKVSVLVEPLLLHNERANQLALQKGYVKVGSGGLELEVGRDANWFGPGNRGALTLSSNAQNFDFIKLSSPEPLDVGFVKRYVGEVKYALIFSRFDETGSGATLRQPYFLGVKVAVKPVQWFEIGVNFVRQEGGPGFSGGSNLLDFIFGGGYTNKSNSIAGIDLSFRIPWLRNTMVYAEYVGEDSALFWPFVESYVAGVYVPRLTSSGKDDLRFEYFYGNPMLYTDFKFPAGYVYNGMPPGHSQGGSAQEFFTRYRHWFSARHNVALEYFHTDRGREGRVGSQQTEVKNALRAFWYLPVYGDFDMNIMYGWERINNFNLVGGVNKTNQLVRCDLRYKY